MSTQSPVTTSAPAARPRPARADLPPSLPLPPIAQTAAWLFRPIPFLESARRRIGPVFTMRLAGLPPIVALSDPAAVREVFQGDPAVFHAGQANAVLRPILGESSLLLLDGQRHQVERKLMTPAFHGERMQAYGSLMRERADAAIDRWPLGRRFSLHKEMQDITLDVILRAVFGLDDGERQGALRAALVSLLSLGEHPALLLLIGPGGQLRGGRLHEMLGPWSPWRPLESTVQRVDDVLRVEIARRRASAKEGTDVLSMLLAARDEEGRGLDDAQLVDEMKTLLVAGHETTATALTWTMLERIGNPALTQDTSDEHLDAIAKESLRLHPVVPMIGRQLQAPARVGGRTYPAGTVLAPNIYLSHREPSAWPDPTRFDPRRFLGTKPSPYEYFPFGGGPRRCIGMAFAYFEMRVVLRQILTRTRLELAPGYRPRLTRRGITFAVSEGLPVVRRA